MTGPQHYAEAERLLDMVRREVPGNPQFSFFDSDDDTRSMLAAAQVHATLALAAATVEARDHLERDRGRARPPAAAVSS